MSYIKKQYRDIFEYLDNSYNTNIPEDWNDFIQTITDKYHHLIIKRANHSCFCTSCKHEFISNIKIHEKQKCPNCKNTFLTRSSRLESYIFRDCAVLLNNINGKLVARLFDIRSSYNGIDSFSFSTAEFGRIFIDDDYNNTFANERASKNSGPLYVYHKLSIGKWRSKNNSYSPITPFGFIYYNNLKEELAETKYKYSQIWDLAKYDNCFDLKSMLYQSDNYKQMELLIKAKMYNLALDVSNLNYISQKDIFNTIKRYNKFIVKYNLNYTQFRLLYLLQEPNMEKIRYLEYFCKKYSLDQLIDLLKYIKINKFIKYAKMHRKSVDLRMFRDYLRFASIIGLDIKNKKYMFPKNLQKEHDKLEKEVETRNRELLNISISKRSEILEKNTFKNKKYIIFPAKSVEALEEESKAQNNCVRTYSEDYAIGHCDIFFMRDITNQDKSLVTIEVKDKKVVQKRAKNNNLPLLEHSKFINKWESKILQKQVA